MFPRSASVAAPRLSSQTQAIIIFVLTLFAFVVESQLTQYVQTDLGYRQPFFIFYLVHASFSIIFPLHLLYLTRTTGYSASAIIRGLSIAITSHLSPASSLKFPRAAFVRLLVFMTIGITCPGLLWFAAVSLATVSDVTAIWNTNAFFAYLISVKLFRLRWEVTKLFAVLLATVGTLLVVYGGVTSNEDSQKVDSSASATTIIKPKAPLVGNLLTLVASFGYGLYQVLYKIYAALPSDPEVVADALYEQILNQDEAHGTSSNRTTDDLEEASVTPPADALYPPPFGLHPNFLTSIIGLITLSILWIPIPILHWSGVETFSWPSNWLTVISIAGIALGGVVFNAGFMILLGVWGPIVTSVGNLLTIVLMLISDVIFGSGLEAITMWSLLGSSVIVVAFGILAYDMLQQRASHIPPS